jgi:hypothetical protein
VKLAYIIHDLEDRAIHRRVRMLRAGGARITALGFRRTPIRIPEVEGVPVTDLGMTYAVNFAQRLLAIARQSLNAWRWRKLLRGTEVFLARNLDALLLAWALRRVCAPNARLVYECLDIHDVMLDPGLKGRLARWLERLPLRACSLVLVSSPAYGTHYFKAYQRSDVPVLLVENKTLRIDDEADAAPPPPRIAPGPPWRIGWYGNVRCNKSLNLMIELGRRLDGLVEFDIRGVPVRFEFEDFDAQVASSPHVHFHGPYTPDQLPAIYAASHFTWAIDFFQEGRNSAWLLPNRLYEGGLFGGVPIALRAVEAGNWLERNGVGILLSDIMAELPPFLEALTDSDYASLHAAAEALPKSAIIIDRPDCVALVETLAGKS